MDLNKNNSNHSTHSNLNTKHKKDNLKQDSSFTNIDDAYNIYKLNKKSELVKKPLEEKQDSLDRIWGGLRSIDKDKFVEDRLQVLKKFNEFNQKCVVEKHNAEKREKENRIQESNVEAKEFLN